MLFTLIGSAGELSFLELMLMVFSYVVLILVMLPIHELAHAWAATKLGDDTARWHGRLTFNPFAHLELWGTLMLFLFGFGYAKPVPVNPRNFQNPKRDMALVALAGPISNLLMATLALLLYRIILVLTASALVVQIAWIVLVWTFASVNVGLAVFNLLPLPPLDGSRILGAVLPYRWLALTDRYSQYIRIALIFLIASGTLSRPLERLADVVMNGLYRLIGFLPFL